MDVQCEEVQGAAVLFLECPRCPARIMARNLNVRRRKCQEELVRAGLVAHFTEHLLSQKREATCDPPSRSRGPRPSPLLAKHGSL